MESTRTDFNNILDQNFESITGVLSDGQDVLGDLQSTFDEVQDGLSEAILDNSETIEDYGKSGFKALFSVLVLINIALEVFMVLICLFSGKMCTNCSCYR